MSESECIACGCKKREPIYSGLPDFEYDHAECSSCIAQCAECGLVCLDPLPSESELSSYYVDSYANFYVEEKPLQCFLVESYYRLLSRFLYKLVGNSARILDVGCSSGHLIGFLEKQGHDWKLSGVEMNGEAVALGRKMNRDIIHGRVEEADLEEESYDLIILSNVIEHLHSPGDILATFNRLLKPGGILYLETPNTKCLDRKVFGRYWGGYHFPRHTFLFSPENMALLLKKSGFEVKKVGSSLHVYGWAISIQNLLRRFLGMKQTNGRVSFYPLLMIAALPLVVMQKLFSIAAGMRIIATKTKQA